MTDDEYSAINTLLAYLESFKVVDLVRDYYAKYNNTAPHSLLQGQMERVQSILNRRDNQ